MMLFATLALALALATNLAHANDCSHTKINNGDINKVSLSEDQYFIAVLRINNFPVAESIDVYEYLDTQLVEISALGTHFGLPWQFLPLTYEFKANYNDQKVTSLCDFNIRLEEQNDEPKRLKDIIDPDLYHWAEDDYGTYIDVKLVAKLLSGTVEFNAELQQMNFSSENELLGLSNKTSSRQLYFNEVEIKEYPIVRGSYRTFTSPIINYNLLGSMNSLGKKTARLSANAYADLLGWSGEYRINKNNTRVDQFLTFSKNILFDDYKAIKQGNLQSLEDRSMKYEVGDVLIQGDELISVSSAGLGANIFSHSQNQRRNFSTINIEETALPGWRALLFRNGEFVAEREVNASNRIVFEDVSTFFGVNTFTINLIGPEGQTSTRNKIVHVGNQQRQSGQLNFNVSAVDTGLSLLNGKNNNNSRRRTFNASAHYGLMDNVTVNASMHALHHFTSTEDLTNAIDDSNNDEPNNLEHLNDEYWQQWLQSLAIDYSGLNSVVRIKHANNPDAGNAWFFGLNSTLGKGWTSNLNLRSIRNLESVKYPKHHQLKDELSLRLRGRVNFPFKSSLNLNYTRQNFINGTSQQSFSFQHSQNLAKATLSNTISVSNRQGETKMTHRLFYTTSWGAWQLRQSLAWSPLEELELSRYSVNLRWPLKAGVFNETSIDYTNSNKEAFNLRHQVNWRSERFNIQLTTAVDNFGDWQLRLGITGSLVQNRSTSRLTFSQPKGNRSRRIQAMAFVDQNRDGILNQNETRLNGVEFFGRPNWKGLATDETGSVELYSTSDYQSISINEVSLIDPFLSSKTDTKIVNVHPGGHASVEFALTPVNDIEGVAVFESNDKSRGVFGLTVRLTSQEDDSQYETRTEADGYYFFTQIPAGKYSLSIDQAELEELGFKPFKTRTVVAPEYGDIVSLEDITLELLESKRLVGN